MIIAVAHFVIINELNEGILVSKTLRMLGIGVTLLLKLPIQH